MVQNRSIQKTRIFGGEQFVYHGDFYTKSAAESAKDKLKYEAFKNNRFVAFRLVKRSPSGYGLYYRTHSNANRARMSRG